MAAIEGNAERKSLDPWEPWGDLGENYGVENDRPALGGER